MLSEHGEICCEGYRLDAVTFKCVKCDVGYWGSNCEIRCPFPTYGDACQQLCDCEERRCNSVSGCMIIIGTWNIISLDTTSLSTDGSDIVQITVHVLDKESKKESTNTLLIGLLGVNSLVVIAACIYIVKCMLKKYRLHKRNMSTSSQMSNDENVYQTEEMNVAYQVIHDPQYTTPLTYEVPIERHDVVKIERELHDRHVDIEKSGDYLIPVAHSSKSDS
ncbi:scavenger receptor class F member 2-like isoform X2 [Ostrea edulis]|uniref:scavenger receptor class F member 2-like isoform X2 n=1 Tax=Ostrea edulis TaxID=37623 RepID=UPI0020952F08|nr:scavenger receptor class F member 2-like isoform X2 [Ostrea edulis]XP_056015940.1 scavenger receptor class F member 2-like isoform X2 [Ostrea edulis]